jgi:hypothetical protein
MNVFVVVPPENLFWFLLCCFMWLLPLLSM